MADLNQMKLSELFLIIETNNIIKKSNLNIPPMYNENEIYNRINCFYFQTHGEKLSVNHQKKELYEWAKAESRYPLLNELIKLSINRLEYKEQINDISIDNRDLFMINNMNELINIMLKQYTICLSNMNIELTELPKLNKEEVDNYIFKILSECDPTLEWQEIYQSAKKKKRIIYLDEYSEKEKKILADKMGLEKLESLGENICIMLPDGPYILLTYTGTIYDISITIHELAHYIGIIKYPNNKPEKTLSEFPSIFYELYTLNFLKKMGYDEKEILTINYKRLKNTMGTVLNNSSIFHYIRMYLNENKIEKDADINFHKDSIKLTEKNMSKEMIEEIIKIMPDFFDYEKSAFNKCDECIKQLILRPFDMYDSYPYILGNYLAIKSVENLQLGEDILPKMKYYTENISTIDPYEVFESIGCDIRSNTFK